METTDRYRGCLLGLAAGDAVGTTVEFMPRGSFRPVTDMVGGGEFRLRPGEWTDDTSMALCLATSLVEMNGFDPADQMDRYCRWAGEGYLASNGRCFDIGGTVAASLRRYRSTGDPFAGSDDPRSAGNGSIMRLAPVAMFYHPDEEAAVRRADESSRTTHGALECLDACRWMAGALVRALDGRDKEGVLFDTPPDRKFTPQVNAIARGAYREKSERAIRGSGYVVESLEAALWSFLHSDSFEEAVLKAANLGDDADTTAAVCGQLAGAFYGAGDIPSAWLKRLVMGDEITALADRLIAGRRQD